MLNHLDWISWCLSPDFESFWLFDWNTRCWINLTGTLGIESLWLGHLVLNHFDWTIWCWITLTGPFGFESLWSDHLVLNLCDRITWCWISVTGSLGVESQWLAHLVLNLCDWITLCSQRGCRGAATPVGWGSTTGHGDGAAADITNEGGGWRQRQLQLTHLHQGPAAGQFFCLANSYS